MPKAIRDTSLLFLCISAIGKSIIYGTMFQQHLNKLLVILLLFNKALPLFGVLAKVKSEEFRFHTLVLV